MALYGPQTPEQFAERNQGQVTASAAPMPLGEDQLTARAAPMQDVTPLSTGGSQLGVTTVGGSGTPTTGPEGQRWPILADDGVTVIGWSNNPSAEQQAALSPVDPETGQNLQPIGNPDYWAPGVADTFVQDQMRRAGWSEDRISAAMAGPTSAAAAPQGPQGPTLSAQSQGLLGDYGLGSRTMQESGYFAELFDPVYGQAARAEAQRQEPTNFRNLIPQIRDPETGEWIDNPQRELLAHYMGEAERGDIDARAANLAGQRFGLQTLEGTMAGNLLASDIAEREALRDYGGMYGQRRSEMGMQMQQAGASLGGSAYQNMLSGLAGQAATDRQDLANRYNQQRIQIATNAANAMVSLVTGANIASSTSAGDAMQAGLVSGQSGIGSAAAQGLSDSDKAIQYGLTALSALSPVLAVGAQAYTNNQET